MFFIIQQKFWKFKFFYCAHWKNSNFLNFCWMIRTQTISLLKLFLLYISCLKVHPGFFRLLIMYIWGNLIFRWKNENGSAFRKDFNPWHITLQKIERGEMQKIRYTTWIPTTHCSNNRTLLTLLNRYQPPFYGG